MDLQQEKTKVAKALLLPVDEITFTSYNTITVSVQGILIGEIPYSNLPNGISYNTQKASVNWLKWDLIAKKNIEQFLNIAKELDSTVDHLTIGDFRRMYAKDKKNNVLYALELKYEHSEWSLFRE